MRNYFFINHDKSILVLGDPVAKFFDKYRPFKPITTFEIITQFGDKIARECYEKRYVKLPKRNIKRV